MQERYLRHYLSISIPRNLVEKRKITYKICGVMADAGLFRIQLLCFIQNNCASTARSCLATCIKVFYDVEEISRVKSCLFDVAKSLNVDGLPPL